MRADSRGELTGQGGAGEGGQVITVIRIEWYWYEYLGTEI